LERAEGEGGDGLRGDDGEGADDGGEEDVPVWWEERRWEEMGGDGRRWEEMGGDGRRRAGGKSQKSEGSARGREGAGCMWHVPDDGGMADAAYSEPEDHDQQPVDTVDDQCTVPYDEFVEAFTGEGRGVVPAMGAQMRWEEMGWDGMRWDEMGGDGMRWDEMDHR
jgi:hypothetical protein